MRYGFAMSTITIKDIPPSVHRTLKMRAKAHGRSLNKEVIATLESTLRGAPIDAAAVGAHARAVRETLGVYLTERDLSALKNAGRR
jgi:plasmid stability protein